MPTVSYSIVNTADDGAQFENFFFLDSAVGSGVSGGLLCYGGLRFIGVGVPRGAAITAATLTLKTDPADPPDGSAWGSIKGVAVDSAPPWSTTNPALAPKTTQAVTITNVGTRAYDVTTIVAAIVARSGWASGNALAFAMDPTGSNGLIGWIDRSQSATDCARLSITYETGGTPPPTRRAPRHSNWL